MGTECNEVFLCNQHRVHIQHFRLSQLPSSGSITAHGGQDCLCNTGFKLHAHTADCPSLHCEYFYNKTTTTPSSTVDKYGCPNIKGKISEEMDTFQSFLHKQRQCYVTTKPPQTWIVPIYFIVQC
jgi:hypothetical protein